MTFRKLTETANQKSSKLCLEPASRSDTHVRAVVAVFAGLVFLVRSLCPWTGKTCVSSSRIHTKSAGKPTARGEFMRNDCLSSCVSTGMRLCVSNFIVFKVQWVFFCVSRYTVSLCPSELSIRDARSH